MSDAIRLTTLLAGLTADINGNLDLNGTVSVRLPQFGYTPFSDSTVHQGTLDSGKIKIFEVGIPGLDFPGCVAVFFRIHAE